MTDDRDASGRIDRNCGRTCAAHSDPGRSGFGGVLGFEFAGGFETADAFLGHLRYARRSASLGGVESLAVHPASMWRGMLSEEQLSESVPPGLVPGCRGHRGHARPGRRRTRRGRRRTRRHRDRLSDLQVSGAAPAEQHDLEQCTAFPKEFIS
ncbi:PLP-dependent transferase [Streptomyces sp. NPDC050803]|uniref:PLP-dependent transferase n=1 Tax=unclassified Streptomyces TaxID=2593676 RepID=UPI0034298E98